MKIEQSVISGLDTLVTGGGKEFLWSIVKNGINYNNLIEIFVDAGNFVACYENPVKSKSNEYLTSREEEQGELRSIVFCEDNMKKLAEHMFKVSDFDFKSELESCLDSYLNDSSLSEDNKAACKKHFIDIVIEDIKKQFPDIIEHCFLQQTYNFAFYNNSMIQQMGNLQQISIDKLNEIAVAVSSFNSKTYENDAQIHNNRKIGIGSSKKIHKWKLSYHNLHDVYNYKREQILSIVEDWKNERKLYPGWFIIPCDVHAELKYKMPYYIGNFLNDFNDEERMYITYEFVWRYETGMLTYDTYMQGQIYSVWKKYYLRIKDNDEKYINEWFYVGRALLREFREDGNEKDWNYVWNKLNEWGSYIENGNIILHMDKVKYYFSIYNMNEVRRLLQRMNIPDKCYDIYLSRAGIEIECGNLDAAERLLKDLINNLEIYKSKNCDVLMNTSEHYSKKQIYIDSVYTAVLRLYAFLLQGIALKKGEYEMYQEEINSLFDKVDNMSYCFDFNGIIDFARKSLLEWQTKKYEKKETFELNHKTVNIIGGNTYCEESYYLYRVFDLCSFPIICNNVNLLRSIEVPWVLALYEAWPQIALNMLVRCSESEIGKYIITRKRLINRDTKSITKEIRYLNKILEYGLDEFEEISVDLYSSVCDYLKNNIPEILIRYMSRCPEDIQIEVLHMVKKIMEKQNVVMDNHMDNFVYMIMQSVSEKNKGIMLEELLQTDIVEHKVMYGHWDSMDLFTWYFRKDESKKYCKRTKKISEIIRVLLSDEEDDNYVWQTKIKRLNVLSEMDLLTSEEKSLYAEKGWSRVNPNTNLPDMPDWYAWAFLKFESKNNLPAVSVKDYLLKKRLMFTFASEEGCNISMRKDTYLDEMNLLMKNVQNDFWTVEEAELIIKDAIDYWELLKSKIAKSKRDSFVNREYKDRLYKIVNMLAGLYENITKIFSNNISERVRKFIDELEQYNFGVTVLKLLFEKEEQLPVMIENIIEHMYDIDGHIVVDAMEAAYSYIKKYPDNKQSKELLENMILILKARKEPGLVTAINLIHNLVYIKNALISKQIIQKIDKCLLLLEKSTQYEDEDDVIIKHKAFIRRSCMGLAYQITDKYIEYADSGVKRWQAVCNENEFAEVKNEML